MTYIGCWMMDLALTLCTLCMITTFRAPSPANHTRLHSSKIIPIYPKRWSIGLLPAPMALVCDMQKLTSLWLIYIISKITQLPLAGHNVLRWGAEPAGCCTIKVLYKPIDPIPPVPHFPWTCLWSLPYLYTQRFSSWYGTCCMGA